MAKAQETFLNMDMSKMLADFDPSKMTDEFMKMAKQFKLPGVDMDSLIASQRKNVEAVTAANRVAFEGVQAVAKRQAEILQETMNEAASALDTLLKSGNPTDAAAKQVEIAKQAYEKALANMRELAEMVSKSNDEATQAINARITESLDEIKDMAMKMKV